MPAMIRMYTCDAEVLTTEEFEALEKEVMARAICNDVGVGERILARLISEHMSRYYEAKAQNIHEEAVNGKS